MFLFLSSSLKDRVRCRLIWSKWREKYLEMTSRNIICWKMMLHTTTTKPLMLVYCTRGTKSSILESSAYLALRTFLWLLSFGLATVWIRKIIRAKNHTYHYQSKQSVEIWKGLLTEYCHKKCHSIMKSRLPT